MSVNDAMNSLYRYAIVIGYPFCGILIALLCSGAMIQAAGVSPAMAFSALLSGAFGNLNSLAETLLKASPLLLTALGMCAAFQCRLWNIGAEGQLYLGALAATVGGMYLPLSSPWLAVPALILCSFLAGGCWAVIPGWLKARFGVSEIITTIMMNYIAIFLVSYAVHGPLRDPQGYLPQSAALPEAAMLPILMARTRLHAGILLGVASASVLYILFKKTTLGFQMRIVGHSPLAARYSGIHVERILLFSMMLSGGLAGIAGMGEVIGVHHRLLETISPGYGYSAIVIALLSYLHPLVAVVVSVLFAGLIVGADAMQRAAGLPSALAMVIQGLLVLGALGSEYFVRRHLRRLMLKQHS